MALERGRPATSPDRAAQAWRREAIELRDTVFTLREKVGEARARICEALEALGATGAETHAARTRLMEALDALVLKGRNL